MRMSGISGLRVKGRGLSFTKDVVMFWKVASYTKYGRASDVEREFYAASVQIADNYTLCTKKETHDE